MNGIFSLSPLFILILSLSILLASVCTPKISGTHGAKKSSSYNEVVLFEEPVNAIKSTVSVGPVADENLNVEKIPLVSTSLEDRWRKSFNIDLHGHVTFPVPPLSELEYVLVGLGEIPKSTTRKNKYGDLVYVPGCGRDMVTHINADSRQLYSSNHWCNAKSCPQCYPRWLKNSVDSIADRLLCSTAKDRNFGKRLVHIAIEMAVKDTPVTRKELKMCKKDMSKFAKSLGVYGACEIFHPSRANDKAKKLSREAHMPTWMWIRSQPNPTQYIKDGPHLHMMAYIGFIKPQVSGQKFTYTLGNHGKVIDFRGRRDDIIGLSKYLLSHTVDVVGAKKFKSFEWTGSLAKFKTDDTVGEETQEEEAKRRLKLVDGPEGLVRVMSIWDWKKADRENYDRGLVPYGPNDGELDKYLDDGLPPVYAKYFRADSVDDPPPEDVGEGEI